ncbi:MAG: Gfo/Idh/MocA family oxidoreductase [Pseudolabrys sp.]|jgi:predicted dehydrogenase
MSSKLSIGIVGAGAIGRAHIETIAQSQCATIVGVSEPNAAARAYAEDRGLPCFETVDELIDKARPDAAIIATPNDTHRPVALKFIAAGIPVLIEKPVASSVEDGLAIAAAAKNARVPVLVGHHRRHNPIIKTARAMVAGGELGRLVSGTILAAFLKPPGYFEMAWRRQMGGGPILINLVHEIDLVRHVCGEIATVQALSSNNVRGFEVEDTAGVILGLENGAVVTISLSDTAATPWNWDLVAGESPNYPPQTRPVTTHFLCGTDGALGLPTLEHWEYRGEQSWFAPISTTQVGITPMSPYVAQLNHFCRAARGEEEPLVSADDGARTLRVTLAVHHAARTGQTVVIKTR